MEKGQKKKAQHPHHPHHVVPKHESGYTDEVAIEAHDLIDKAEEDAHVSTLTPPSHDGLMPHAGQAGPSV